MNGYEWLGVELLFLAGGAAVLVALLFGLRAFVELVPVTRSRRDTLRQAMPVVTTLLALAYCVLAVRVFLAAQPAFAAVGTALVFIGFAALSFGPLRDLVSGVFLKAGRVCEEGDHVRIDELSGRITRMGLRVLVLETSDGEEAVIPYGRVARDRLLRTSVVESVSAHVFRVRLPAAMTLAETKSLIRRRALLVHWSAISRLPEVSIAGDNIEVTVYAIDPDRGPDIEAEVRKALAVADPPPKNLVRTTPIPKASAALNGS